MSVARLDQQNPLPKSKTL